MTAQLRLFIFIIACFGNYYMLAAQDDKQLTFTRQQFLYKVLAHHPLAKQALLIPQNAKMEIRVARGGFDPTFNYFLREKKYAGTEYFLNRGGTLKIPGWPGPELKMGFEQNSGQFLNSADKTPSEGLLFAGFSLPIGQGLFMDERRAALRQAQAGLNLAQAELIKEINKLLLNAAKDYWLWMEAFYKTEVLQEGLSLAEQRNFAVQQGVEQGQLSGLDSVESGLEVIRRKAALQEGLVFRENMRLALSTYLWSEAGEPEELMPQTQPEKPYDTGIEIQRDSFEILAQYAAAQHPELLKLRFKEQQLQVEKALQREYLKPVLNLEYYPILTGNAQNPGGPSPFFRNNYKFGMDIYFPLFLRKARGKLAQTKLKINALEYETDFTMLNVQNQLEQAYNEYVVGRSLVFLQDENVRLSQKLRNGEDERFKNGESSFFLVNIRERSLIDARLKWLETMGKYQKSKAVVLWSAGLEPE